MKAIPNYQIPQNSLNGRTITQLVSLPTVFKVLFRHPKQTTPGKDNHQHMDQPQLPIGLKENEEGARTPAVQGLELARGGGRFRGQNSLRHLVEVFVLVVHGESDTGTQDVFVRGILPSGFPGDCSHTPKSSTFSAPTQPEPVVSSTALWPGEHPRDGSPRAAS